MPVNIERLKKLIEEAKENKRDCSNLEKKLAQLQAWNDNNKGTLTSSGKYQYKRKKGNIIIHSMSKVRNSHFTGLEDELK